MYNRNQQPLEQANRDTHHDRHLCNENEAIAEIYDN